MSKKKLIIVALCMILAGCGVGGSVAFVIHTMQQQSIAYTEAIARLEQSIEEANEKAEQASEEAKKAEEKSAAAKKKANEYKEKLEELEKEKALEESTAVETIVATPDPTVVETPVPQETPAPSYPIEAYYNLGASTLVIVGPDENSICTGKISCIGNLGNDIYEFSGTINIDTGVIPFSNCTRTWESNSADREYYVRSTGGTGALVYIGNGTWRFDDYTGGPDNGKTFSYSAMYEDNR